MSDKPEEQMRLAGNPMTTEQFFEEARRLNLRMLGTPDETRAALDLKDAELRRLHAECERLRAVLAGSADFWAHYSSLNESEQDELNPKRHETLDAMRAGIDAARKVEA